MGGWRSWMAFRGAPTELRTLNFFVAEGGDTSSIDGIVVEGDRNLDLVGEEKKGLVGRGRSLCSLGRGMTTCMRGLLVDAALCVRKLGDADVFCLLYPHSILPCV